MKKCKYEGCGRPVKATGLCRSHYRMALSGQELRPLKTYKRFASPAPGKKVCTRCERVKELDDFYARTGGKGKRSYCKECSIEVAVEGVKELRRKAKEVDNAKSD